MALINALSSHTALRRVVHRPSTTICAGGFLRVDYLRQATIRGGAPRTLNPSGPLTYARAMNTTSLSPTPVPLIEPISGPACWTAQSLRARQDWIHPLSDAEVADLNLATDGVADRALLSIEQADFPLPVLSARLGKIRSAVLDGTGLALVRGLPVAGQDEARVERMLWGLGLHLGVPQPQDASSALLHHVRDTGVNVAGRDDVRTFETNEAQPWHNDGGDMFLLLCRDVATSGGKSYLASVHTLFNALLERDPALVRTLQSDFHFDSRGQGLPGRGQTQTVPIFTWHNDRLFILHKRHYIEAAQRFDEVPRLSPAQIEALDALEEICDDPDVHLAFDLEPGDLEIANNFAVLHKRGAFDQASDSTSRRHMLRLWLGLPDGWPLPESFRETREYGPLFKVRK